MLILCPSCASSYNISEAKLGKGRTVRCKKCQACWYAAPPAEPDAFDAAVAPISDLADSLADVAPAPIVDRALAQTGEAIAEALDPAEAALQSPLARADAEMSGDAAAREIDGEAVSGAAPDVKPPEAVSRPVGPPSLAARLVSPLVRLPLSFRRKTPAAKAPAGGAPASSRRSLAMAALPYAAFGLSCAGVVALAAQGPISAASPAAGKLYAALGLGAGSSPLAIVNLISEISPGDGGDVLVVQGELVSRAMRTLPLPTLKVVVRDEHGVELYAWPAQSLKLALEPGERTVFRARLASPPPNGRSVQVKFESEPGDAHSPRTS
ncbi:MJ0042-type zinc finger domain-containing protein [Terrarubrum flagellatum]|uniref:MJ0042-type zinc finger domain-containing protein n=1 Tax=Terrirubrum flagellatum TaxID=2895980 RepID=UPI0031451B2F